MKRLISIFILLSTTCLSGCSLLQGTKVYTNPDYNPADIGYLQVGMPQLPALPSSDWLNAAPAIADSLYGKVVLIDFWDYTCVNCLRTLPYLTKWYSRYSKDGLVIIGIHSPEFQFARERKNLAAAVGRLGIRYPVVMDNSFTIWKEFGNQSWPEEYLFDRKGILRYTHIGEGEYGNTEEMIQRLLREGNSNLKFPRVMQPVRPTDAPGAVCYLPTSETYLGYGRGRIGNKQGYENNRVVDYTPPASVHKDKFYLVGKWKIRSEYVRYAGGSGKGELLLNYSASSVDLVIRPDYASTPRTSDPIRIYVYLDGLPVPADERPAGMKVASTGKTYLDVTDAGMYHIVDGKSFGRHTLAIETGSDAFAAYSFTFGTTCAAGGA